MHKLQELFKSEPLVLRPYHPAEAITVRQAGELAKRCVRTVREWAARFDLGRRIGGTWSISKVALLMHLEGNREALALYHRGDRASSAVVGYFERCGVPLPRCHAGELKFREALTEPNSVRESL